MQETYLGRIVAIGRSKDGRLAAMYRVSSRSFPNRRAAVHENRISIVPKEGHEGDVYKNPYIAYNCATVVNDIAIVANGSQTDPIAEKIASGMCIRDALVYSLAVMDYEKDDYDTPRIAAVVQSGTDCGWLASVRKNGIDVRCFDLAAGDCFFVATYQHDVPSHCLMTQMDATNATDACDLILGRSAFQFFTNPVTAVALMESGSGFESAAKDAPAKD